MPNSEGALVERADLDVTRQLGGAGMQLRTVDDFRQFCEWVHQSHLAPSGFDTPQKIFVGVQTCLEAGLHPLNGLGVLYVVHGKVSWLGTGALALIRSKNVCAVPPVVKFEGNADEYRATWRFQRRGDPEVISVSYSVKDAKVAGLWGKQGPWSAAPGDMLAWRAAGRMGKMYFSDVLLGIEIYEVVRDAPPEAQRFAAARTVDAATATTMAPAGEGPAGDPLLAAAIDNRPPLEPLEPEPVTAETEPPRGCVVGCLRKSGHRGECYVDPDSEEASSEAPPAGEPEPDASPAAEQPHRAETTTTAAPPPGEPRLKTDARKRRKKAAAAATAPPPDPDEDPTAPPPPSPPVKGCPDVGCLAFAGHEGEHVYDGEPPPPEDGDVPGMPPPPVVPTTHPEGFVPFNTPGETPIGGKFVGQLRGEALRRCGALSLNEPDARFTLISAALRCAADEVTEDRYDAAREAIKAYNLTD